MTPLYTSTKFLWNSFKTSGVVMFQTEKQPPCTCLYPSIILQIHRAVTAMHMTEKHFRQYKIVTMSRPTSQLTYYSVMVATCLPLLPNSWQPIKAITEQFKVTCDVNKKQRCHYPPSRAKLGCQVQLVPAAPQQCPHGN